MAWVVIMDLMLRWHIINNISKVHLPHCEYSQNIVCGCTGIQEQASAGVQPTCTRTMAIRVTSGEVKDKGDILLS